MHRSLRGICLSAALVIAGTLNAADAPKSGGTVTVAVGAEPGNWDCHGATNPAVLAFLAPHYSTLLRYEPAAYPRIVGDVAESWTIADDGLSYAFKLRPSVLFHDGTPLTAADVKATFDRLRRPPPGIVSARRADFTDIADIETPDPVSVVFRLTRPNSALLAILASPWNCLYSAARLAEDPRFPATRIMGTGPFTFVDYVRGGAWTGARFERYFAAGRPRLDGFKALAGDAAAAVAAFAAGSADATLAALDPAAVDRLRAARGDAVTLRRVTVPTASVVTFNARHQAFNNVRVRRALNLAIDRWGGIESLSRTTSLAAAGGLLRPGSEFAESTDDLVRMPGFGRDIAAARDEAKRLLNEAGVRNMRFRMLTQPAPPYPAVAQFLVEQWRQIGVNVEIETVPPAQFAAILSGGGFEAANDFNIESTDEPVQMLAKYTSRSPRNHSGATDPALDDLYDQLKKAREPATRRQLAYGMFQRLMTGAYVMPLFWDSRSVASARELRGWNSTPSPAVDLDMVDAWLDR